MDDNQTVDFLFLFTALILAGVGLVMVYSSSMYLSMDEVGDGMYYFKKQALRLLIGLVLMMFLTKVNYRGYAKFGLFFLVLGFVMLSILLVQKHMHGHGIARWLRIGRVVFQPSEIMKVIIIIYLSSSIALMGERIRDFKKGFLPLLSVITVTFALVVLEPDFGTSGLILVIGFSILFVGRAKLLHLMIVTLPVIGVMGLRTRPRTTPMTPLTTSSLIFFISGRLLLSTRPAMTPHMVWAVEPMKLMVTQPPPLLILPMRTRSMNAPKLWSFIHGSVIPWTGANRYRR